MSKRNYYNEVFTRNYDKVTTSGYYDYEKEVEGFKEIVKGKQILELGIGTGCLAELLVREGYEIEGIEPSEPMIKEFKKKNLPIKVYKQDASELNTGKKYFAIFSHGALPMAVLRNKIEFDFYILEINDLKSMFQRTYEHLKHRGLYLCGVQPGENDNIKIGDFYKNEIKRQGDIITKTHYFKEEDKWVSQTVKHKVLDEKELVEMMEKIGFKTIGLNNSKTWYVFEKI